MEKSGAKLRYPILLLHGVGFRDLKWPLYWGRIPSALSDTGAMVFYGKQDCWARVEENAKTIKARIRQILEETGSEKESEECENCENRRRKNGRKFCRPAVRVHDAAPAPVQDSIRESWKEGAWGVRIGGNAAIWDSNVIGFGNDGIGCVHCRCSRFACLCFCARFSRWAKCGKALFFTFHPRPWKSPIEKREGRACAVHKPCRLAVSINEIFQVSGDRRFAAEQI